MAGIDGGIGAVAQAFTQVADNGEEKLIQYVEEGFRQDPNLRFRIATFLKNSALRATLKGDYGTQPGAGPETQPMQKAPKETKLNPTLHKFSQLARHPNSNSL